MFELDIPGFGPVKLEHLVSDYTGTLSLDGVILPRVEEYLNRIAGFLKIHILTADTFGKAKEQLRNVHCEMHILTGAAHDVQKESYVNTLGPVSVVAVGNGNNDRLMLGAARIGIAVMEGEGCSSRAMTAADITVRSAESALGLLLNPKRLKATLRF